MSSINVKMDPAILTVLLAAAERLYQRDKYATLRVAALMERLVKEEDLDAAFVRLEGALRGTDDERDEIEELKRNLGL